MLFGRSTFYTTDPVVVKHILKDDFGTWDKGDEKEDFFAVLMREWLGAGIFSLRHSKDSGEYDIWKLHRKLASVIFTKNNFRNHMNSVF